jgi:hypothetical protein
MPDPEPDFEVILKDLARAGVDFITPPVDDEARPTGSAGEHGGWRLGRDRDKAVLPILRRTLQERQKNRGPQH